MFRRNLAVVMVLAVVGLVALPGVAEAGRRCYTPCCAPPPPVAKELCVKDPCTGCCTTVTVCIPACCCDEEPCVTCRPGIFGRIVLTYTWKNCGHCVDVVINKHGRVRVRG